MQEDDDYNVRTQRWRGVRKTAQNQKITIIPDVTATAGLNGQPFDTKLTSDEELQLQALRSKFTTCLYILWKLLLMYVKYFTSHYHFQTNRVPYSRDKFGSSTWVYRILIPMHCDCTPIVVTPRRQSVQVWRSAVSVGILYVCLMYK